jgi:4,5-DOPA dioxygenase extradiol
VVGASAFFRHRFGHTHHIDCCAFCARTLAHWMGAALTERRTCDLLAYRRLAPFAARNHPTEEHLLPLFVALGAAGPDATATRLHASNTYGVLRMDAYAFGN